MIRINQKGDFSKTIKFLQSAQNKNIIPILERYGREGVNALAAATPVNTGTTAKSWYYEITKSRNGYYIAFKNSNIQNGVPIAIILQYGHGTRNGGWVEGKDYINPAIQPIFDKIADSVWKEVTL